MNHVFQSYLKKHYSYTYLNGPDKISTEEQAQYKGLNCIALMHLLLKELFSTQLPNNLRGWEIFCTNPYFVEVLSLDKMQCGDIIFIGRKNISEFALAFKPEYDKRGELTNAAYGNQLINDRYVGVHLAMFTGEKDENNSPLFIHANKIEKTVSLWSLQKFQSLEQYTTIHRIKHIKTY